MPYPDLDDPRGRESRDTWREAIAEKIRRERAAVVASWEKQVAPMREWWLSVGGAKHQIEYDPEWKVLRFTVFSKRSRFNKHPLTEILREELPKGTVKMGWLVTRCVERHQGQQLEVELDWVGNCYDAADV